MIAEEPPCKTALQLEKLAAIRTKISPKRATVAKIPLFCAATILTASFVFSVNLCADVIAASLAFLLSFAARYCFWYRFFCSNF